MAQLPDRFYTHSSQLCFRLHPVSYSKTFCMCHGETDLDICQYLNYVWTSQEEKGRPRVNEKKGEGDNEEGEGSGRGTGSQEWWDDRERVIVERKSQERNEKLVHEQPRWDRGRQVRKPMHTHVYTHEHAHTHTRTYINTYTLTVCAYMYAPRENSLCIYTYIKYTETVKYH